MSVEKTIREILIKVTTGGNTELKALADSMSGLNNSVSKMTKSFGLMGSALGSLAAYFSVRQVVEFADSMQLLRNRITTLTGDASKTTEVMAQLLEVADRTKTPVDDLTEVYARLSVSLKSSNISSESLVRLSEALQNTFRLSGSNAQEAANASVQLSQALSLGVLRGQDFKSVLSQNAELGNVLSKSLGVTRGQLQKMAEAGELTARKVLVALANSMDEVNGRANQMSSTFGQTLTAVLNDFKFKIDEINQELDISGKFAKGIDTIKEKFTLFLAIIGALALTQIPALIASIGGLTGALGILSGAFTGFIAVIRGLTASNIVLLALTAIGAAILYVADNFEQVKAKVIEAFKTVELWVLKGTKAIVDFGREFDRFKSDSAAANDKATSDYLAKKIASLDAEMSADKKAYEERQGLRKKEAKSAADIAKEVTTKVAEPEDDKRLQLLKKLNAEYVRGKVSVSDYYDKLETLDKKVAKIDFVKGKLDLTKYNEELQKFNQAALNRDLAEGKVSMDQWNKAIEQNKIKTLNIELESGKINLQEFDQKLISISSKFEVNSSLRAGIEGFMTNVKTIGQGIAAAVEASFDTLGEAIFQFTKKGKFDVADMTQAILDDLNKIIIRAIIIKPLAGALLSSIGTDTGLPPTGVKANAKGDVFNSPTLFGYGQNKMGLLGEAGPEAIIPLKRAANGDLGVQASSAPVYVNIVNNSGGNVEQRETTQADGTKMIDILITNKVKESIASGQFDRTFQQAYGLRRRGT